MADTLDVLTLAEGKQSIVQETNTEANFVLNLESLITGVSRALDGACGPIVQRTITGERHDGGAGLLFLREHPVVSITTVNEYASGTATLLTAETDTVAGTYRFDSDLDVLYRRSSWSPSTFAAHSVVVTYVAGRYDDTASVDVRFKEAARETVAHMWRLRYGAGTVSFGADEAIVVEPSGFLLPKRALDFVRSDLRGPVIA